MDRTVREARLQVEAELRGGIDCPCCDQYAKEYPRQIHSSMAALLILFHRYVGGNSSRYIHLQEVMTAYPGKSVEIYNGRGDFAKLLFWGLVEAAPSKAAVPSGGRMSGYWRITFSGVQFVLGVTKVQKTAWIYNNVLRRREGPMVGVSDCLRKRFSYEKLMQTFPEGGGSVRADQLVTPEKA